jgi:hypothetical protein
MGFDALVRKGMAIVNKATLSLQVPVIVEPFDQVDKNTKPLYLDPILPTPTAIVKLTTRVIQTGNKAQTSGANEEVVVAAAKITFVRNIAIKKRDRITTPDGISGPVVAISGLADPAGGFYGPTVWITKE